MAKRVVSLLLALATVLSLCVSTFAAEDAWGPVGAEVSAGSKELADSRLPAPIITEAASTAGGVKVTWSAVAGAGRYRLYYKVAGADSWKKVADTTGTSYTWTGAASGTKYAFTVRAYDSAGGSGLYDKAGRTVTYLAAPQIVKVAGTAAGVKVTWNAVAGISMYRLYYKTTGGWKKIADTAGTSYTWTGAENGTKYAFTVKGFDQIGTASAYDKTGASYTCLTAPEITGAASTAGGVKVTWSAVAGAGKYRLYYKVAGADSWKKVADTAKTSYTWAGAESGTEYAFTVRAYDSAGASGPYDKAGRTVTYLAAPQIVKVADTAGGIKVTWNAVAGISKYRLYYKTAGGWKKVADTAKTSYTWTGAESGTKYTFTVKGFDQTGTASAYDKTGTSYICLTVPEITKAANTVGGVKVSWSAVAGAGKYRLYYKVAGADSWKKVADTTKTSYTWTGAESGTEYVFTVRAYDSAGASGPYDKAGVSVKYLAAPELDKPCNRDGGIKLTWNKVAGASKYRLYYKTTGGWKRIGDITGTSYTWKGAEGGTVYNFTVRACAKDGAMSGYTEGKRTMLFSNSPLVSYTRISPNRFPDRNNIIDTITIHCVVGQCSVESLGATFAPTSKSASSNYGIGADGRIGMYVEEKDSSKCSSDRPNDHRAVTIEVASNTYDPYWVNPTAYASLIDLVTDICQRNGIEKLVWSTDKNERVNHLNGCNMTVHRDYANKSCPGAYLYDRMGQIAAEVNARLSG